VNITIKNFGPFRDFTINLNKDFHLLVGKNNIGKSYAITAVYLIVKSFQEMSSHSNPFGFRHQFLYDDTLSPDGIQETTEELSALAKKLKPREEVDIKNYVLKDVKNTFEAIFLQRLKNSFANTFTSLDNLRNRYSNETPSITIDYNGMEFEIIINDERFEIKKFNINKDFFLKRIKQNRDPNFNGNKYTLYYCEGKESEFINAYIHFILFQFVIGFINGFSSIINSVHYLPASRSGLYQALSAFGQIIAELSKNRSFLSKKIELPGISEPVSDYFIRLSDIRVQKKSFEDKEINKIAKEIEEKILKGRVEFNSQTKQLMFYPIETNLKLELSSTSSMVSELAPIVSYLRYVLTENAKRTRRRANSKVRPACNLIMIEEPEAHLHPEIQLLLTEIFSKLVNQNVKLVITSHSNYIFNKVNNLIMSDTLSVNRVSSGVFKSTKTGSVLHQLEVNELGVEDNNFNDATSALFDEKMKIISKLNNKENACD